MSIYRIDPALPQTTKIKLLNDMILELNGLVGQANFDKNELDSLYQTILSCRKFQRGIGVGNTLSTYTGWSHIHAETGYSIWKYTPTSYAYSVLNNLYMSSRLLENRGLATAETATIFDKVYLYDGALASFVDDTTEAGTETGTGFDLQNAVNDYLYVGHSTTFGGVKFEFKTRGANYTPKVEYWTGSAWIEITANTHGLEDNTNDFQSSGSISFNIPSNWNTNAINSVTKYWLRISTTTVPVTVANAYYIIPSLSVIGLLALSSTQVQNEEWAWCSYSGSIYATIRNSANATTEGDWFITSSSSTANKQNFFVYNNPFTADYELSTYDPSKEVSTSQSLTINDSIILARALPASIVLTLPAAHTRNGKQFLIKKVDASANTVTVETESGETVDGAANKVLTTAYQYILVFSDNANWHVIG